MKDFFENFGKRFGETAEMVTNKAGEMIEIQRVKSQIRDLARENAVDMMELGKAVYERYKSGEELDDSTAQICDSIKEREKEIEKYERKIAVLKGSAACVKCGRMVSEDMAYCPYCGEKMEARDMEEATEEYAEKVKEKAADVAEAMADKAEETAKKIGEAAQKAAYKTEEVLEKAADKTTQAVHKAAEKTTEAVHKAADKAEETAHKSADKAEEAAHRSAEKAEDAADKTVEKLNEDYHCWMSCRWYVRLDGFRSRQLWLPQIRRQNAMPRINLHKEKNVRLQTRLFYGTFKTKESV